MIIVYSCFYSGRNKTYSMLIPCLFHAYSGGICRNKHDNCQWNIAYSFHGNIAYSDGISLIPILLFPE
jgi:hypothetical protein